MSSLEEALAAVPPGQTSVHTLRDADEAIPDLPRRLVAALAEGSLRLAPTLDAPPDAPLSFGLLAVLRWLARLPASRLVELPSTYFASLLDEPDEKIRLASAQLLAHFPREAYAAFVPRATKVAQAEARAVAAALALGGLRDAAWTDDEALAALPALEQLASSLRAQPKKDASDAAEMARRRVVAALREAVQRDDVAAFERFARGAPVDGRMPGELSQHFTFLAQACSSGARALATWLLARGADASRALLGLAPSESVSGLALLLELARPSPEALATAFDAAVISPRVHRAPQVEALAPRLAAIELTHALEPQLPLLATLARFGLIHVLLGRPEQDAMLAEIPEAVLAAARARDVGLELAPGARYVELVRASRLSLAERMRRDERHAPPTLEQLDWMDRLTKCEAKLKRAGKA